MKKLTRLSRILFAVFFAMYVALFELQTVLREVEEDFTPAERERLFEFLMRMRAKESKKEAQKRASLEQVEMLWSMLPDGGVEISDETLDEMKAQRRMEKYG